MPIKRVEEIKTFYEMLIEKAFDLIQNSRGNLVKELDLKDFLLDIFRDSICLRNFMKAVLRMNTYLMRMKNILK